MKSLLRCKANLGYVQLLERVEHGNHALILDIIRTFDHHRQVRVIRLERSQLVPQLRDCDWLPVNRDMTVRIHFNARDPGFFLFRRWRLA